MKRLKNIGFAVAILGLFTGLQSCDTSSYASDDTEYYNPEWAPEYYPGARYYYLPDIETYYDLAGRDFVYLDNGNWLYSNILPPMYSGYDLRNGYVIVLDRNVYQPWMHHQYYISHYPRYYYRGIRKTPNSNPRSFNENGRAPVVRKPQGRVPVTEPRKTVTEPSREPQKPNYYGKDIGKPVKVRPQMRESPKAKTQGVVPQNTQQKQTKTAPPSTKPQQIKGTKKKGS